MAKNKVKSMEIQKLELNSGVRHSAIWGLVLITIVAFIGLFWGQDGYKWVAISLATMAVIGLVMAILWATKD